MEDLLTIFQSLQKPDLSSDVRSFSATVIEGSPHHLAKDSQGCAVLLLTTSNSIVDPAIRLEHLSVEHRVRCRVTSHNISKEGTFTVVACRKPDEDLVRYFLRIIDPVIRELGPAPSAAQITGAITHLVELFRALTLPPTNSLSGLWAELFLIRVAKDPVVLMHAWHNLPEEKYDFSANDQRIEVKSDSQRSRVHHFALEQLSPPSGCKAVVVSVFVSKIAGGISLQDLVDELRTVLALEPKLLEKLDLVVARTLGDTVGKISEPKYDREFAVDSLRVFEVERVPRIVPPLPHGISEVHFKADLTNITPMTRKALSGRGSLLSALGVGEEA